MTTSIVVDNVTKSFRYQYHRTFKQLVSPRSRGQANDGSFKALDGVSFEVAQG